MKIKTMEDLDKLRKAGLKSLAPKQFKISISMSSCGHALGADTLYHTLIKEKEKQGLKISIGQVGCSGFCDLEPMAVIRLHGRPTLLYTQMTVKKVKQIVANLEQKRIPREGLLCTIENPFLSVEPGSELNEFPNYKEVSPFKDQHRRLLENCGIINPLSVSEYVAMGGYAALYKALYQMAPEEVVEEVIQSGLRGRGGAWFPTGIKWDMARKTQHDYIMRGGSLKALKEILGHIRTGQLWKAIRSNCLRESCWRDMPSAAIKGSFIFARNTLTPMSFSMTPLTLPNDTAFWEKIFWDLISTSP